MQIRLPLKIKNEVKQIPVQLIDDFFVQFQGDLSGVTGEFPQTGRTFGAPQIAGCGGFNGNRERIPGMMHPAQIAAVIIT
jgi:hypothetical protein